MREEWEQQIHEDCKDDDDDDEHYSYSSSDDEAGDSNSSNTSHMQQHPIKRGLSKFYQGKSQSFSSFSDITSVNDLAKKVINPTIKRKIKPSRSHAGGLDANETHKPYNKPVVNKDIRGSCASSIARTSRLPPIPMHKNV